MPKKTDVKDINFEETLVNTKKEKKIVHLCSKEKASQTTVTELVESHNRQYRSRSPKPKKVCKTCTDKNAKNRTHCFFCGSSEHLQIDCLNKRNNKLLHWVMRQQM